MTHGTHLLANITAEEGNPRSATTPDAVARVEALWRDLFEPPVALKWLEGVTAAAWWNTAEAEAFAAAKGTALLGASAAITALAHDKAFALEAARRARMQPVPFDRVTVLEPALLEDHEAALRSIREGISGQPAGVRSFTLKPRIGTAGRGRVSISPAAFDADRIAGNFGRLAARGGALLEPWVERVADYSTQLLIEPDGQILLLGTMEQLCSGAGLVQGHRGLVDSRGRVSSGAPWDEDLREGALEMAMAASAAGYRGPCGVDAFTFRNAEGEEILRPIVEFNARFTVGLVALGQLRRAIPAIRSELGLSPGDLRAWALGLSPPRLGWPELRAPSLVQSLYLDGAEVVSALAASDEARTLDGWFPSRSGSDSAATD